MAAVDTSVLVRYLIKDDVRAWFRVGASRRGGIEQFQRSSADFSDCMHCALARLAAQEPWWTFDKAASQLDGAALLKS